MRESCRAQGGLPVRCHRQLRARPGLANDRFAVRLVFWLLLLFRLFATAPLTAAGVLKFQ